VKQATPLAIEGWVNVALILGVVASIIVSGQVLKIPDISQGVATAVPWIRDGVMVGLGLISMAATRKQLRIDNNFNFGAITEVAVLFIGIFITMIPALMLLEFRGTELGVTHPLQYFWVTGALSGFLDNTPTYLTFLSLAKGAFEVDAVGLINPELANGLGVAIVRAISLGAVFMGAATYIGNGPNFMVKAIAEEKGATQVKMPSFGGYMLYSFGILVPILIVVSVIFFYLAV
ncbi:MAG TPA: sodium:proton antiporter, partial [Myxococcota bacterium]|nr:sodium:proton antiporter [Myxococcota bacterium]